MSTWETMPARSERARRRRSSAASASAARVRAAGAAAAAAGAGGGGLLTETTRSGRRRAVDLAPRLFCIAWGREMGMEWGLGLWGEGRNGREGKAPETGKFERGLRSQGGQAEKATGTDDEGEQNTGGALLYDSCRESRDPSNAVALLHGSVLRFVEFL